MPKPSRSRPPAEPGPPPHGPAGASSAFPAVQGHCPACGDPSLFLGEGGYVTCSRAECPEPDAASTLLERDPRTAAPLSGLVSPGLGGLPLGPCIREPHDDHVHHGADGVRWWPVDGGAVTAPPTMTDQEVAELRARWTATAGRDVAITITRGEA
jgi:hypothetical protein